MRAEYGVARDGTIRWPVVYVMEYVPFDEETYARAVKVGMSIDVENRAVRVWRSVWNHILDEVEIRFTVETQDAMDAERAAHKMLAEHALGGEWFDCSVDKAIECVKKAAESVTC